MKGKGYGWGLSSVIFVSAYFAFPLVIFNPAIEALGDFWGYILIFWVCTPAIGFTLAFVGSVRSEYGTKANRLCNIGAGIGWLVSAILMFFALATLWKELFSLSAKAAEITALIDTALITGYFFVAYVKGKLLWFI